jgi:endonuclease YncB( thermonuclease family)
LFGAIVGLVWWLMTKPAPIQVIDGDTVKRSGITHRLKGFDVPEIKHARCELERVLGRAAKKRLEDLIREAQSVQLIVGRPDRYSRFLSVLKIDGEDVQKICLREGWCKLYVGRGPKPDWCIRADGTPAQ